MCSFLKAFINKLVSEIESIVEVKERISLIGSFYSPSDDEVRQSDDEGANGHQYTAHCNDLWPMELGPKVTDESYHQQVTWADGGSQKYQGFRVLLYIHTGWRKGRSWSK